MDQSLSDSPALGKNPPGYYSLVPRSVLANRDLSPGAKNLYVLLDSYLGGRSHRISRLRLADDLGIDVRSITTYLQELEFAGLLTRKRTGRTSIYALKNEAREEANARKQLRKEISFLSDRKDTSDPQSNKPLVIKNKQQGEEAPLERSSFPSADVPAGAKPFKVLSKEKRDYVSAFNSGLEIHLGARLDLNSLKQDTLEALIRAQDQGLTASDLASRCSQKLNQEQQAKALNGNPIRNPIAYLVSVLPSWIDTDLWSSSNQATPDYPPAGEHLPHTPGFYDLFLETEEESLHSPVSPEEWEQTEQILETFRKQAELNRKQGKL